MSAVASHHHKTNRRHVHFRALNWEEEEQRTNRGVEIRRERQQRKHEQKMAEQQRERDRWDAFLVLRSPANEARILQLCLDDEVLASAVDGFLRGAVRRNQGNRQEQLERFRLHNGNLGLDNEGHYELMRNDTRSMGYLSQIAATPVFVNEFLSGGTVVPDSNSDTSRGNASANSSEIGTWGGFHSVSSYTVGSNDSMIGDGGMQAGGVEGLPAPEVEVHGNHVVNHAVNRPAPVDPPDDGGRQGGGVEEPPVPEEVEVANQLAPVDAPVNAVYAAAAAAPDDAADNDSRSGIKRHLSPKRKQDDDAKKQRIDN